MFPVSDFNFVVAGIATFAATVGYACTRQLGATLSGPVSLHDASLEYIQEEASAKPSSFNLDDTTSQDQDITSSTLSNPESLKRKNPDDGFDEENEKLGYPDNLATIYPNKRSRTPSSESDNHRTRARVSAAESSGSITSSASNEDIEIPFVSQEPQTIVTTPAPEPPRTPSPAPHQHSPNPVFSPAPTTVIPIVMDSPRPIAALPKRPSTPKTITSSSGGFAAFAGSTSIFASPDKPQQPTASNLLSRPIWTTSKNELEISESSSSTSIEAFSKPAAKEMGISEVTLATSKYTHITGEEEEDVELELKSVKLFVKRGNKSFSDGMMGHIKLLSNRKTLDERILFRREPLWKVSLNIRVQPTVRCSYVPEENVLRIVLKEVIGGSGNVGSSAAESSESQAGFGDATQQEVVVYALKPGRSCSKHDFKEFAESLTKSSHLKASSSSTLTSVTATTATTAADSSSS